MATEAHDENKLHTISEFRREAGIPLVNCEKNDIVGRSEGGENWETGHSGSRRKKCKEFESCSKIRG